MKTNTNVIEKYEVICPLSYMKCESFSEVEYKIEKCITLGQTIKRNGEERHVQYYYNCFVIKGETVVDMFKNMNNYVDVRDKVKNAYDWKIGKVIV